jgi:hypothetical protein
MTRHTHSAPTDLPETIDGRILKLQERIRRQDSMDAKLSTRGHELTDATRELRELIISLAALIRIRNGRTNTILFPSSGKYRFSIENKRS